MRSVDNTAEVCASHTRVEDSQWEGGGRGMREGVTLCGGSVHVFDQKILHITHLSKMHADFEPNRLI